MFIRYNIWVTYRQKKSQPSEDSRDKKQTNSYEYTVLIHPANASLRNVLTGSIRAQLKNKVTLNYRNISMKRPYKMTDWDAIHNQLIEDLQVMDARSVADKHNVKYSTLMSYCVRNDIDRPVQKPREALVKPADYPEVKKLYEAGVDKKQIAKTYDVSVRSVNRAINNIYRAAGRAICWWFDRVPSSEFRNQIGKYLDKVLEEGAIIITSEKRGEMVLMDAHKFNKMNEQIKAYEAMQQEHE